MKNRFDENRIAPMDIIVHLLASMYDWVYDLIYAILSYIEKVVAHIKKTNFLTLGIEFFAGIYDLNVLFFAGLYDIVYDFLFFLVAYVKWATDFKSYIPPKNTAQNKESSKGNDLTCPKL
jgi:hypothetical protein